MKVLVLTNMYPNTNAHCIYQGIFVKEQYESLSKIDNLYISIHYLLGNNFFSKYVLSVFSIYKLILKRNFDIVHIHYGLTGVFLVFKFILRNPPVFVLTCHGSDLFNKTLLGRFVRIFSIYCASKCDSVICISDEIQKIFIRKSVNTYLLPCGVNLNLFKSSVLKNNYFVFPGSKSNKIKNFSFFNQILKSYNQLFSNYSFKCLDGLNRYDAAKLIQNSSGLIMTSHREGSPQSVKEALACDIPVISSDVGDVSLLSKDLPGTFVFSKDESPDNIAKQVHKCISESQSTLGRRRSRIEELGLSNDEVCLRLFGIYKLLLQQKLKQS